MKPGNLRLGQDLPHHDQLTPNSAPYFIVRRVGVMKRECCRMVLLLGDVCVTQVK